MSLEKILERIKMIEENDFRKSNKTLSEDISLDDVLNIFRTKDTNLINSFIGSDKGFRDAINTASQKLGDKQILKGSAFDGTDIILKEIYKLMQQTGAKISDINYNTMEPVYGFQEAGKTKTLKNNGLIIVTYSDSSFTKLKTIEIKKGSIANNNFNDLYTRITSDIKSKFITKNITMSNGSIIITF